jgi:AraC family transcriptional regulator
MLHTSEDNIERAPSAACHVANDNFRLHRPARRSAGLDLPRLQRVLVHIEAQVAAPISLDDLARVACLSPFHFSRLFLRSTGLTPHRYVVDRRIALAKPLILKRAASLAQIALDTGFGSQASFSRAFRRTTGLSPNGFRDLNGG